MSATRDALLKEYSTAFTSFIETTGEGSLAEAGLLGRRAVADGLGVLEFASIHQAVFAQLCCNGSHGAADERFFHLSNDFFYEALAPFEVSHQGFMEMRASISRMMKFIAIVSHELRTPLTGLMSSTGMLAELVEYQPGSTEARLFASIASNVRILKARSDDLIDLTGFQSGALKIRRVSVDIVALLTTIVQSMTPLPQDIEVHVDFSQGIPNVKADPDRLGQVVSNLLENALKYGRAGKRIDVRAYVRDGSVLIEVQDYGAGVPMQERMLIWEPYFRGSRLEPDVAGLGIGLSLCQELVRQHEGSITLESEEGKGSLFRVRLPLPPQGPTPGDAS
jgi:signal transduction histidine kinase